MKAETADTVYVNASVYTVNESALWAEAFAVVGDRFVAVGKEKDMKAFIGDQTRIVDLDGQFVLPGLVEDHVHPDMVAENRMGVSIQPSEMDWPEQAELIKSMATQVPGKSWLVGGNLNWLADNGENIVDAPVPSHYSTLDALVSGRPAMLWDIGGHAVLLNSVAMAKLQITAGTPNPEGGVIVKDAQGIPTGVLRETAANHAYEAALKELPRGKELIDRGIKPVFDQLNRFGFTAISDVWARFYMLDAYRDMFDAGELTVRVRAYIADPIEWKSPEWKQGAEKAIANHQNYYRENWLDASGVKFVLDGSAGGQTIIMVEPYEGTTDVHGGPWRNDPEYFREKFLEYDARGITIKSHGVGSQSIRTILDVIEEARERGSKLRHSVAHAVLIHPDDRQRFSELDVVAEFSPYFWYPVPGWDIVREELGQRRLDWAFPFNTLQKSGVHISVGSDWPVADSPNPFLSIESMITRKVPGGDSRAFPLESEGVSLEVAIRAFTMGGAYAQGRDTQIGSIETGKLADFVILDQNPFEVDVYNIHKTRVQKTVVGGRTVYQANSEG
ncbi:MAG: amidohydrolase [Halieaceae bacterium]|nr:amidohydrolase [Halieaceae bacterium]